MQVWAWTWRENTLDKTEINNKEYRVNTKLLHQLFKYVTKCTGPFFVQNKKYKTMVIPFQHVLFRKSHT